MLKHNTIFIIILDCSVFQHLGDVTRTVSPVAEKVAFPTTLTSPRFEKKTSLAVRKKTMAEEKNASSKVAWGSPSKGATCAVAPPTMNINADRLVKYTRDNGRFVSPWLKNVDDAAPRPSRATFLKFLTGREGTSKIPSCKQVGNRNSRNLRL